MAWTIYFWTVASLLLLPLPFKVAGYLSGKDASPKAVKVEEMANVAFFLFGLVGLYSYVYGADLLSAVVWKTWVVLAAVISSVGMFWSPKLKYASDVMGKARTRAAVTVGFLVFIPMLVGVWRAGS